MSPGVVVVYLTAFSAVFAWVVWGLMSKSVDDLLSPSKQLSRSAVTVAGWVLLGAVHVVFVVFDALLCTCEENEGWGRAPDKRGSTESSPLIDAEKKNRRD